MAVCLVLGLTGSGLAAGESASRPDDPLGLASSSGSLLLEVSAGCQGDVGDTMEVGVWMRDLTQVITGFQAFLAYDDSRLSYRGDLSTYTSLPFASHIQNIVSAEVSPGQINLDGSDISGSGTSDDSLLATLVFDIQAECDSTSVIFRDATPFASELSYQGEVVPTTLTPTPAVTLDNTPPTATAGEIGACYAAAAGAETDAMGATTDRADNCTEAANLATEASTMGVCSATVSVTVTDECGNQAAFDYGTRIDGQIPSVIAGTVEEVYATLELAEAAALAATTASDNCTATEDLLFEVSSLGFCPATITVTVTDECGNADSVLYEICVDQADLILEVSGECQGDTGDTVEVELWMRNLGQWVTGFQAFLEYDTALLGYRGDLSSYSSDPFPSHIQAIEDAEAGEEGQLNLDGSVSLGGETSSDALLAVLVFDVYADCDATVVAFRDAAPFVSKLSFEGSSVPTDLIATPAFTLDDSPPEVTAGTIDADYAYSVWAEAAAVAATTAVDNCTVEENLTFEASTDGTCVATITVTVSDECGNADFVTYETCIDVDGDEDDDGITNGADECPETASGEPVEPDGCSCTQRSNRLNLQTESGSTCFTEADFVCVELTMTCLDDLATGFQSFLGYDDTVLQYRSDLSSYSATPFPLHVQSIDYAEVSPGALNLDGFIEFGGDPTGEDAVLATLCFDVLAESLGQVVTLYFRDADPLISKLSSQGVALSTFLSSSPPIQIGATQVTASVELAGVMGPATRCIRFTPGNGAACGTPVSVELDFDGLPATSTTTFTVECGIWTDLCAKDEQLTLSRSTALSPSDATYLADTVLSLHSGDTNNDDLIDMLDVEYLIDTFGETATWGDCPWDLTRDADFDNDGYVGTADYTFLVTHWLEIGTCACPGTRTVGEEPGRGVLGGGQPSVAPADIRHHRPIVGASTNERESADFENAESFRIERSGSALRSPDPE